jgi:hypothetical protein
MMLRICSRKCERWYKAGGWRAGVPISDHVQNGAKLGGLVESARRIAVRCV